MRRSKCAGLAVNAHPVVVFPSLRSEPSFLQVEEPVFVRAIQRCVGHGIFRIQSNDCARAIRISDSSRLYERSQICSRIKPTSTNKACVRLQGHGLCLAMIFASVICASVNFSFIFRCTANSKAIPSSKLQGKTFATIYLCLWGQHG